MRVDDLGPPRVSPHRVNNYRPLEGPLKRPFRAPGLRVSYDVK